MWLYLKHTLHLERFLFGVDLSIQTLNFTHFPYIVGKSTQSFEFCIVYSDLVKVGLLCSTFSYFHYPRDYIDEDQLAVIKCWPCSLGAFLPEIIAFTLLYFLLQFASPKMDFLVLFCFCLLRSLWLLETHLLLFSQLRVTVTQRVTLLTLFCTQVLFLKL